MENFKIKSLKNSNNFFLHHLGYATPNIKKSIIFFSPFFFCDKSILEFKDRSQNVNVNFFKLTETLLIEFVEPLNDKSPILNFTKKNPQGNFHHLAYECKNIENGLLKMKELNFRKITKETIGFENRRIIFFASKVNPDFPLIEIISEPQE